MQLQSRQRLSGRKQANAREGSEGVEMDGTEVTKKVTDWGNIIKN